MSRRLLESKIQLMMMVMIRIMVIVGHSESGERVVSFYDSGDNFGDSGW